MSLRASQVSVIGVSVPVDVVVEIDRFADRELISRASWLRRAILKELARAKRPGRPSTRIEP